MNKENLNPDGTVTIAGVRLTDGAFGSLAAIATTAEERAALVLRDVSGLRDGRTTAEYILRECLSGADEAHAAGWREYHAAIVQAAQSTGGKS